MPRITDLPLVGRVLASFVVVVAALALVTAFAVTGQRRDARTAAELARVARLTRDAQQLKFLDADMSAWQTTYVLDIRREGLSQAKPTATSRKVFLEDKAALEALLKRVDVASMTAAERSAFARVRTAFADFFAADARIWAEYVAARPGYRMRAENAFYGGGIGTYDVLLKRTDALRALLDRRVTKLSATAHDQASSRERTTLVVGLAAVLLALAIALIVARSITRPLREILRAAESLADGDTEHAIALRSRDELGRVAEAFRRVLARFRELGSAAERISGGDLTVTVAPRSERDTLGTAFAAMVADLRALVGRVADGAGRVGSASESVATSSSETQRAIDEIASAVGEVAHGAQRQTNAMESARALTDDVVGATTASARDASETVRSAGQARELIEQGVEAVGHATTAMERVRAATEQATEAMNELGAKGERIGGIVDTISSIAGQTNLLALNAAIEAARAGDQGRGFAVVADEVRKLAEESEHAAGSIAALVAEIQSETRRVVDVVGEGERRTHEGSDTVLAARDSFERIGAAVDDVSSRMEHVAASLERITTSAQDMQQNISEVASVSEQASASTQQVAASTQETSASAQEISASAHDLAATATELTKAVARFRLG